MTTTAAIWSRPRRDFDRNGARDRPRTSGATSAPDQRIDRLPHCPTGPHWLLLPIAAMGITVGRPRNGRNFRAGRDALARCPGTQHGMDFMVKDSKRFADSGRWGWAAFDYDAATDTFKPGTLAYHPPQGNDAKCGFACHTSVKARDLRFHGLLAQVRETLANLR